MNSATCEKLWLRKKERENEKERKRERERTEERKNRGKERISRDIKKLLSTYSFW